jgi:hypothetical protein
LSKKPARILRCADVGFAYPRQYDDLQLFDLQTQLTRECLTGWDA